MNPLNKGLILHGILASETVDKSGETLSIKGLDISALEKGTATANFEHNSDDPSSIIGRIVTARKVFSLSDCKNDLEKKMYKEGGGVPAVMGSVELIDDHASADALAKTILHFKKRGLASPIGFSVEGATLEREGNLLKRSVARAVSLTFKPCNAAAKAEVISELSKSEAAIIEKMENNTSKHVIGYSSVSPELINKSETLSVFNELHTELTSLLKSLEAGFNMGPVGSATQGAALQGGKSEESSMKDVSPKKIEVLKDKSDEVSIKSKKAQIIAHLVKQSIKAHGKQKS